MGRDEDCERRVGEVDESGRDYRLRISVGECTVLLGLSFPCAGRTVSLIRYCEKAT